MTSLLSSGFASLSEVRFISAFLKNHFPGESTFEHNDLNDVFFPFFPIRRLKYLTITPFAVHYEKIHIHLRETVTNSAKIHSLTR